VLAGYINEGLVGNYCRYSPSLIANSRKSIPLVDNLKTINCGVLKDGKLVFEECEPLAEGPKDTKPYYQSCEEIRSRYPMMKQADKAKFEALYNQSI
jgi:hypothetical protein